MPRPKISHSLQQASAEPAVDHFPTLDRDREVGDAGYKPVCWLRPIKGGWAAQKRGFRIQTMKYFIVIDGALNSTHDIFGVDEVTFEIVFPDDTDVAFLDEVAERVKSLEMDKAIFFDKLLLNQVDKKVINGT